MLFVVVVVVVGCVVSMIIKSSGLIMKVKMLSFTCGTNPIMRDILITYTVYAIHLLNLHYKHPPPLSQHMFRPDEKLPPKVISSTFTILVLSPLALLLVLVSLKIVTLLLYLEHSCIISEAGLTCTCSLSPAVP